MNFLEIIILKHLRIILYKNISKILIFFINYLINYIKLIKRALPYFIIMNTEDENPTFDNVTLYEDHDLN